MKTVLDYHALVIGVNAYRGGITALQSATPDAIAMADLLRSEHAYTVTQLVDADATRSEIERCLSIDLPQALSEDSGFLLYFAGHGVAVSDDSAWPHGYLLPSDALPSDEESWLSMEWLHASLEALPCRHLLLVLDCCFAGAIRWMSTREAVFTDTLYESQFARYLKGNAWQALTSAAHNQRAVDLLPGRSNQRDSNNLDGHSPFADALIRGLGGAADSSRGDHPPDGVITATELYQYVFEELMPQDAEWIQTPGIWPLRPDNGGEYVFLNPNSALNTRPDPPLDETNNPWLGLNAYSETDADLFFGRQRVIDELLERILSEDSPALLAVLGASGSGKSSVVKAGLLACLENPADELRERIGLWRVIQFPRINYDPCEQLHLLLKNHQVAAAMDGQRTILLVDQFEELYTRCSNKVEREQFLQRLRSLMATDLGLVVVLTVRSDFEPQPANEETLRDIWPAARFVVPAFSQEELRSVIEGPAASKALYLEPAELINRLLDETVAMPGALPLLSFALAEIYRHAQLRRRASGVSDRALVEEDYEAVGGVVGALHKRATMLYDDADQANRETIKRLFLRLVSQDGSRLSRRRVNLRELSFDDPDEQQRIQHALNNFVSARLLVIDGEYVEPAHDTLVLAWQKLQDWLAESSSQLLMRAIWRDARHWDEQGRAQGFLWNSDPRLAQAKAASHELNSLEWAFILASSRKKMRHRNSITTISVLVVGSLSAAAWFAKQEAEDAEFQSRSTYAASVLSLAADQHDPLVRAEMIRELADYPEPPFGLGVMLETASMPVPVELIDAGRQSLGSAEFSPDGKRIVTISRHGTAQVWSASNPSTSIHFRGHGKSAANIAISADGTQIAAANSENIVRLSSIDGSGEPVILRGHEKTVTSVSFSPDGSRLVTTSLDGTARVWNANGSELSMLKHEGIPYGDEERYQLNASFSPDGSLVITSAFDDKVRVWNSDGKIIRVLSTPDVFLLTAQFSPNGENILTTSFDGIGRIWNTKVVGPPVLLGGPGKQVGTASFSPDGTRIVTTRSSYRAMVGDPTPWVWKAHGRSTPVPLVGHTARVNSARFSPDGQFIVTSSWDGTARVWKPGGKSRQPSIMVLQGHSDGVVSAAFSPDGSRIVTASFDGTARVWDAQLHAATVVLRGRGWSVASASHDGKRIAVMSADKTVHIWNSDGSGTPQILSGHTGRVNTIAFSRDGNQLVSTSLDRTTRVWSLNNSAEPQVLKEPSGTPTSASFSPDGARILTVSNRKLGRMWNVDGSGEPLVLESQDAPVQGASFSPDGRYIATTSAKNKALLWRADGSAPPLELPHFGNVFSVIFSPNSQYILTTSSNKTGRIWNIDSTGKPVKLPQFGRAFKSAFSGDGRRLVWTDFESAIVWNTDGSGEPLEFNVADLDVVSTSFSRDGSRIVVGYKDGSTRVWNADGSGKPLILRGHTRDIISVEFILDDTRVLTTSNDGTVRIWRIGWRQLHDLINEKRTLACLPVEVRKQALREASRLATERHTACKNRRSVTR